MDRLDKLIAESINVVKKAYHNIPVEKTGILWSGGKDSTVMLHIIERALGKSPYLLIHIDTGYKIPEIIKYRDNFLYKNNYNNLIIMNRDFNEYKECGIKCCKALKTNPLNDLIYNEGKYFRYRIHPFGTGRAFARQENEIKGLFVGIRGDEESTRSKEKFFSKRHKDSWKVEEEDMELWGHFNYDYDKNSHIRVHPLLRWTEKDVWEYIKRENIEYIDLYHSKNGERYRTIGCDRCTSKIKSNAKNIDDIIEELDTNLSQVKERSTRKQDSKDNGSLEKLRLNGYM